MGDGPIPSFVKLTSAFQLNPCINLAWSLISKIPEVCAPPCFLGVYIFYILPLGRLTLLKHVQRDDNVQALEVIYDALEISEGADTSNLGATTGLSGTAAQVISEQMSQQQSLRSTHAQAGAYPVVSR
jgi:hypothetical protein